MSLKTRSSIEDLSTIAEIGGRLGITGKKGLRDFTMSANEFAVALGGDFSGGVESAITQFGKVTQLFKDTKDLDIATGLKKAGSAMNSLSAKGVNVEGLTDFSLRVGSLSDVIKPTLAQTTALGAVLQKAGLSSEIASSGFKTFLSRAGNDLPAFASQMKISASEAKNLFNTDSAKFFVDFSASLNGLPADEVAKKLKTLKLNSNEIQAVVGILASKQKDYNDMLSISNTQMEKGTSITEEYNTKNNNTKGQLAKLKNSLMVLAITIGTALLPVINSLVSSLMPYLQAMGKWMQRNKGLVTTIAKIVGAISAFSFALSGIAFVIGGVQKAIAVAGIAMRAFNLLFIASPIGVFAVALGAVAVAAYSITKSMNAATTAEQVNTEARERALEKTADQRLEVMSLFNTLKRAKVGTDEYRSTLQKIDAIQPGITKKYMDQNGVLRNAIGLQKELTYSIMKRAEAEVHAEMYKESFRKELDIKEGRDKNFLQKSLEIGDKVFGTNSAQVAKENRMGIESARQRELEKQIEKDQAAGYANPEQAKQQSMINNKLDITLSGLPEGVTANANGKNLPVQSGGSMKKSFAGTN
jgi:tubulin-specific chaperone A